MSLTQSQINKAHAKPKAYSLSDGGGLYLLIRPNDVRLWRWNYVCKTTKKQKTLDYGSWPDVSLDAVRLMHAKAKLLRKAGDDPAQVKKLTGELQEAGTFRSFAEVWFGERKERWSYTHSQRTRGFLDNDILPYLGDRAFNEISRQSIFDVVQRIDSRTSGDSARKALCVIRNIFDVIIGQGKIEVNPADKTIKALAPKRAAVPYPAITDREAFLSLIRSIKSAGSDELNTSGRWALLLLAHTFPRPKNVRFARRDQFDLENRTWSIPAGELKTKHNFKIPLSDQAIAIVQEAWKMSELLDYSSDGLLFPGTKPKKPLSENTLNLQLRRLGIEREQHCSHGFRSSASTLLHDAGEEHQLIEIALAHDLGSATSQVYNRGTQFERRRLMMQRWSDFLTNP